MLGSPYCVIGIIIGLAEIFAGLVSLAKATKLSPNTYLGFRVPVAFLARNLWVKVNRLSGVLGICLGPVAIICSFLDNVFSCAFAFIALAMNISIPIIYARRIVERETGRIPGSDIPHQTLKVIRISRVLLVLSIVVFAIIAIILIISYENLPNMIAVHFDLSGRPNIFMAKHDFVVMFSAHMVLAIIILLSLFVAIDGIPNLPEFEDYNNKIRMIYSAILVVLPTILLIVVVTIVGYNVAM